VVVVVVGFTGCTVVSSDVVVVLDVWGSSDAQPESAAGTEASRQESKSSFFIILISYTRRYALAHGSKRTNASKLLVLIVIYRLIGPNGAESNCGYL